MPDGKTRDHPRLRGEKFGVFAIKLPPMGSSPLTRGKACLSLMVKKISRIIPAYAGKRLKKVIKSF